MSKQPLSVLVVGMDQRSRAALRLAFLTQGQQDYVLHGQDDHQDPDLAIVDGDGPDGRTAWESFRAAYPHTPAIYTSMDQLDVDGAECIRKPLRVEALFAAMARVLHARGTMHRSETRQPLDVSRLVRRLSEAVPHGPPSHANDSVVPFATIDGRKPATEFSAPLAPTYFDPTKGLLSVLTALRKQGMAAWIDTHEQRGLFALFPDLGLAHQAVTDADLSALCIPDLQFSYRSIGQEALHLFEREDLKSLDALIWQVAIRTSKGRLPLGIKTTGTNFRLRQWPNFTRLEGIPDALRVAAFLSRTPASIALIAKMLSIQPEHLYSFISAAASLGLLERVGTQESQGESVVPLRPPMSRERHGMLTRLLRRIAGR